MKVYDCVIIGGGFSGICAGIYLSRYNRSALIIDKGDGRWNSHEITDNYLGFPKGIFAKHLRELGLKQALRFSTEYIKDVVTGIIKINNRFYTNCKNHKYESKTIILATGVTDLFPHFNNWQNYVGKSLFWCITCDGYKTINKNIIILGHNDEAAVNAMQFLNFTNKITFVTNLKTGLSNISSKKLKNLKAAGIQTYEGQIIKVFGRNGMFKKIELNSGTQISFDYMFCEQGSVPNSNLAKKLKVEVDENGYILTDLEQRTNIPFVYAAGDVTKFFAHQIVSACHEGATAGTTANYDLYRPEQKED